MARLKSALREYRLIGPKSNINFLFDLCSHQAVVSGGANTRFIDSNLDELIAADSSLDENALISAAIFLLLDQARQLQRQQQSTADPCSPWADSDSWRPGGAEAQKVRLQYGDQLIVLSIREQQNTWNIETLDKQFLVERLAENSPELKLLINGSMHKSVTLKTGNTLKGLLGNVPFTFTLLDAARASDSTEQQKDRILSPMPGKIIACSVKAGQAVKSGESLMVIEAMKMEHAIQAPHEGSVVEVFFTLGDLVEDGDVLLAFKE